MKKKRKQYLRAANLNDDRYMPDTQRQGWGRILGANTFSYTETIGGVRRTYRADISVIYNFIDRVVADGGTSESTKTSYNCLRILAKYE